MNNETKEIDLIQFCLYLWNRIIVVLIVSFLCAAVFVGYDYHKQKSVTPVEYSKSVINTIVSQNRAAFYAPLNQPKPYTYDTVPSGACYSNAKLFIDFNYTIFDDSNTFDTAAMSEKIQSDMYLLLVSNTALQDVIDKLDLKSYDDMNEISPDTLRWMISGSLNGSNVMEVFVTDTNPERAKLISEAVIDRFINDAKTMDSIDSVKVVDNPSMPVGGISLSSYTQAISKFSLLKYGLIGFVLGLAIIVFLYMVRFIINDPVMDVENINSFYEKVIGTISKNSNLRDIDIKRVANNIALSSDLKNIAYIPVDKTTYDFNYITDVSDALKDIDKKYDIICFDAILEEPDVLQKLNASEGVVLGVTYGVTKKKELKASVELIKKTEKEILGVVINNTKYV